MKTLIPLTSLPRSGSTLLMHILNQNPNFTVGPTSQLSPFLVNINEIITNQNFLNKSSLDCEALEKSVIDFCREGTNSWIANLCPTSFFIDKSRCWIYNPQFMFKIFPQIKMILNIRDLRFIVNSFEKINNNSLFVNLEKLYGPCNFEINAMQQRIDGILNISFLDKVLISLKQLSEYAPTYRNQILIFRYEDLILSPQESMNKIYNFLEITKFKHDFENIKRDNTDYLNQNALLPFGDHKIREKLDKKSLTKMEYIPEDVSQYIITKHEWFYEQFYPELL